MSKSTAISLGRMMLLFGALYCALLGLSAGLVHGQEVTNGGAPPDLANINSDTVLKLPGLSTGDPAPGKMVMQSLPAYVGTEVAHALYLPTDWQPGKRYPVIIEYNGNNRRVQEIGGLGYGISGGQGFIWAVLPFVAPDHRSEMALWWGDVAATVAYAKEAVPAICRQWGGDPAAVILVGHSRGAIACNYIGLHDDQIARLWRAMVPCSHYDNGIYAWGMSPAEQALAVQRLHRLGSIPQFICGEYHLPIHHDDKKLLAMIRKRKIDRLDMAVKELGLQPMLQQEKITSFVTDNYPQGRYTFVNLPFVNHTPEWVLRDIPERRALRAWMHGVLADAKGSSVIEKLQSLPGLLCLWTFREEAGKPRPAVGRFAYVLKEGNGPIARGGDGPVGGASCELKPGQYFTIPRSNCPGLDIHGKQAQLSVLAWVQRTRKPRMFDGGSCEAIAGLWNESQRARQYCLFLNLPKYGGKDQVCGHISGLGGPSIGEPFCKDYSASVSTVRCDTWEFVGFTYDGRQACSYINGVCEPRAGRNPYPYDLGIYDAGEKGSDFTVGAVDRGGKIGNFFVGRISGLMVFDRVLSSAEILDIYDLTKPQVDGAKGPATNVETTQPHAVPESP